MTEYKIYKSPWKAIRLMLLCTPFVAGGIFLLGRPDAEPWIAWGCILFFGLGYPAGLMQLLDRRPQIVISETGIFDRMAGKDLIRWDAIRDAYPASLNGQKFICLAVDRQSEPSHTRGAFGKGMAGLSKALGFQELNISLGYVSVPAEQLVQLILAMSRAEPADRASVLEERTAYLNGGNRRWSLYI